MYTEEQIRNAGKEGEINYHEVEHIIATLKQLYGDNKQIFTPKSKISEESLSNDIKLALKIASTRDKPFFVGMVRELVNSYLKEDISTSKLVEELNITAFKWCEKRDSLSKNDDKSLYETQICLQTLINRVRQAVNKNELILSTPFQKAFDNALYIIKKYSTPSDAFRIIQSESKESISEDDIENIAEEIYSKGTPFSIRGGKDWMIYKINDAIKTGYVLAQQHTNSKLEEIEKWCDEVNGYDYFNTEQSAEAFAEGVKEVKSKIQSLKAE